MKANQLATLVLRLLGIYCLIQVVPTFSIFSSMIIYAQMATQLSDHSNSLVVNKFVPALIPSVCWLVIAIMLLVRSVQWGEKITKGIGEEKITEIPFEQVQVLAFAVVGVLLFAEGVSQLFGSVNSVLISSKHSNKDQYPEGMQFNDWHSILIAVGAILKAALGLWMFFGARGFTNFWRSLKNFGTPKPPEN